MNKKLLCQVADYIEKYPDTYNQGTFCHSVAGGRAEPRALPKLNVKRAPECCTQGCIAGIAVMLTPKRERPKGLNIANAAQKLLRLDDSEADLLFYGSSRTPGELRQMAKTGRIV